MRLSSTEATISESIARDRLRAVRLSEDISRIIESGPWHPDSGRLDDLYEDEREVQMDVDVRMAALYDIHPIWVAHRISAHSSYLLDLLLRGETIDDEALYEYNSYQ